MGSRGLDEIGHYAKELLPRLQELQSKLNNTRFWADKLLKGSGEWQQ